MGGSGINRYTPELDHWSLAVKDGKALENEWLSEIPIPRGGPHRFVITSCQACSYKIGLVQIMEFGICFKWLLISCVHNTKQYTTTMSKF